MALLVAGVDRRGASRGVAYLTDWIDPVVAAGVANAP